MIIGARARIFAAIALASGLTACRPPDYGVVLAYTYDLTVQNDTGAARFVVPENSAGVGPNSVAYLVPPDGHPWASGGATLGDAENPQIYIFDTSCHLVAQLEVPRRTSGSAARTPYTLNLAGAGATLTSPASATSQPTPGQAAGSDLVELCPRTDPPMWGT